MKIKKNPVASHREEGDTSNLKQGLGETFFWCSLEGMMLKLKLQYFGHLM